ncbi:MAG: hypothetical protein CMC33_00910 [Flavobacteriaceae bacterium]|nr:hypothetical protein [Flavobacteriaceae bacterium]
MVKPLIMIKSTYNFILFLSMILLFFSCQDNTKIEPNSMNIIGNIEGLRKGDVFLQKVESGLIISIDSVKIKGDSNFILNSKIDSPEIFYLYLKKEDGDTLNDRLLFFGEKGEVKINTILKTFESSASIKGSENNDLLNEYISFKRKFNDQNLSLLQKFYESKKEENQNKADSIEQKIDNLIRRRYLYTLNFASKNYNKEVSPYIALTEINDANLKLLDTLLSKMSSRVLSGKYGKQFKEFLEERHKNED